MPAGACQRRGTRVMETDRERAAFPMSSPESTIRGACTPARSDRVHLTFSRAADVGGVGHAISGRLSSQACARTRRLWYSGQMNTAPAAAPRHLSLDELRASLQNVRDAPRERGRVHLVVRRPTTETRETLEQGVLDEAEGLVGDNWRARVSPRTADAGPHPDTQITLMSVRAIGAISPDEARWPLAGDQLFVDLDLTYAHVPPGTRLQVGDAVLEVTAQPHTGCGKFIERFGVDAMKWVNSPEGRDLNLRGIYARVVTAGRVSPGDVIAKVGA